MNFAVIAVPRAGVDQALIREALPVPSPGNDKCFDSVCYSEICGTPKQEAEWEGGWSVCHFLNTPSFLYGSQSHLLKLIHDPGNLIIWALLEILQLGGPLVIIRSVFQDP